MFILYIINVLIICIILHIINTYMCYIPNGLKKNESKIEFLIIGIQKKITFHAFVFELSNHFPKILQSLGAKEKNKKKI